MNGQTTEIVNIPGLDSPYYLDQIIGFMTAYYPHLFDWFKTILGILIGLSIPISLMLFIGIIYTVERLKAIRTKEADNFDAKVDIGYDDKKGDHELSEKWEKVDTLISSQNQNDWRQAILEADIMLASILTKMGYKGDGIGEQLQRVVKGDFQTLDQAWEAHKVRNMIAHDGSNFSLDHHEAKRVINLYKQVFQEFFFI
ncbi:MAG: hypothetical protein AAB637_01670 [Patescibacteria group bacterium]